MHDPSLSQSRPLFGCLWNLQPLSPPDQLDALEVDDPAGFPQQRRHPAIAIATLAGGKRDDVGSQRRLIVRLLGNLALRLSMLAENATCKPLETPNVSMARSTQTRRRAGLTSFPKRPINCAGGVKPSSKRITG
jgi:hypothetical protein